MDGPARPADGTPFGHVATGGGTSLLRIQARGPCGQALALRGLPQRRLERGHQDLGADRFLIGERRRELQGVVRTKGVATDKPLCPSVHRVIEREEPILAAAMLDEQPPHSRALSRVDRTVAQLSMERRCNLD